MTPSAKENAVRRQSRAKHYSKKKQRCATKDIRLSCPGQKAPEAAFLARLRTLDDVFVEGADHAQASLLAGGAVRDRLGDHRVVVHANLGALRDARVDANVGRLDRLDVRGEGACQGSLSSAKQKQNRQRTDGRKILDGVLGVDARLKGPAVDLNVGLGDRESPVGGNVDHVLDNVLLRDELGDRVLDLEARVHLEEVKVLVRIDEELARAGRVVPDGLGERDGLGAHGSARLLVQVHRRRLLDDLLVATLDRALALVQVHRVAKLVTENLDLDVARVVDELFDEEAVVVEARLGLRLGETVRVDEVLVTPIFRYPALGTEPDKQKQKKTPKAK